MNMTGPHDSNNNSSGNPPKKKPHHFNRQRNHARPQTNSGAVIKPVSPQVTPIKPASNKNSSNQSLTVPGGSFHQRPRQQQQNRHPSRKPGGPNNHQQRSQIQSSTPKTSTANASVETLYMRHLELIEYHMQMRKKYYEQFYRGDERNRKRLERDFFKSIETLRNFESNIPAHQKERFNKLLNRYPLEKTYTENHHLPIEGTIQEQEQILDPHVNMNQLNRPSYKEDREESVGALLDYQKIKGLA